MGAKYSVSLVISVEKTLSTSMFALWTDKTRRRRLDTRDANGWLSGIVHPRRQEAGGARMGSQGVQRGKTANPRCYGCCIARSRCEGHQICHQLRLSESDRRLYSPCRAYRPCWSDWIFLHVLHTRQGSPC